MITLLTLELSTLIALLGLAVACFEEFIQTFDVGNKLKINDNWARKADDSHGQESCAQVFEQVSTFICWRAIFEQYDVNS